MNILFLSLKPLINGQAFYHNESQFTDLRRMDIVVDWGNQQCIIGAGAVVVKDITEKGTYVGVPARKL